MSRIDFALLLLVSVLGFALCWQIGRIGYLPLDQSIVFDGAWRVVSGQVPWRDFITPNGLSPILMQALVFQLFGVSWATYVGHAAALNAVGSGAVYRVSALLSACQTAESCLWHLDCRLFVHSLWHTLHGHPRNVLLVIGCHDGMACEGPAQWMAVGWLRSLVGVGSLREANSDSSCLTRCDAGRGVGQLRASLAPRSHSRAVRIADDGDRHVSAVVVGRGSWVDVGASRAHSVCRGRSETGWPRGTFHGCDCSNGEAAALHVIGNVRLLRDGLGRAMGGASRPAPHAEMACSWCPCPFSVLEFHGHDDQSGTSKAWAPFRWQPGSV